MPLYRPARAPLPNPVAGQYQIPISPHATATSATLGTGTLRLAPWVVEQTLKVDRMGAEVTVIGDAGSKFRIGIYADTGNLYPGALLLDAGQIAGDSATVQDITISTLTLGPGLYWLGGVVQTVTTTQPTMRQNANWTPPVVPVASAIPAANATAVCYTQSGVTAALPSTFTATVAASGNVPRIHVRAA